MATAWKRKAMKFLGIFFSVILFAGCSGAHKKGISRFDDYDSMKVDQMVGNKVSSAVLQKTIVCLNARRESRRVTAVTNVSVMQVTNQTVVAVTNQTISVATNFLFTVMTNLSPLAPGSVVAAPGTENVVATSPPETNAVLAVTNTGPALSTNVTVSVAANQSATIAPNQTAANSQLVRTFNNQLTTSSNNLTIAMMTNLVVTADTNQTVNFVTNSSIASVTNVIITPTNFLAYDYFLYTEMTPPPDFTLASGESLILLVDGVRYGFTQGQSGTAFVGRKNITSGLYRVPPEVLVAIANAKEVRIRFKGANSVVERTMNDNSKQNFKTFLVRYFSTEPTLDSSKKKMAATETPAEVATR
jgi:hypothetical protein